MEREPGTAPFLSRLHNFTFGATPSLGLTGAAIIGMKYGVPRLVSGLVRDLFREDAAAYYRDLVAFAVPELETLESAFEWIGRLGAEALDPSDKFVAASFQSARAWSVLPRRPSAVQGCEGGARVRNENLLRRI